jgi:Niemann-Pick C1 protein
VQIDVTPESIWVPPDSRVSKQKAFFDAEFSPFFRINQLIFSAPDNTDLLTTAHLQKVFDAQRSIEAATVTLDDGTSISLDDLCFKPIEGQGCLVESPAQYWLSDPVLSATDTTPALTAACQTQQPVLKAKSPCMDSMGTPVMRNVVLGGIGQSSTVKSSDPCGGSMPTASALIVTFLLNNYDNAEFRAQAEAWEAEVFIQTAAKVNLLLQNDLQTPLNVSYMAGRSVQDSLSTEAKDNAWIVAVSYAAMFVYVAVALGTPLDRVKSRYKLAATGIVIVLSSLCIAIGLLSAMGLKTTLIVWEVVPFLALAIGVDNMFIITRQFDRVCANNSSNSSNTSNNSTVYSDNDENSSSGNTAALLHTDRDVYTRSSSNNSTYDSVAKHIRRAVVSMFKEPTRDATIEQYMGVTLATVGPSILGAGVCEVLAFAVGKCTDSTLNLLI